MPWEGGWEPRGQPSEPCGDATRQGLAVTGLSRVPETPGGNRGPRALRSQRRRLSPASGTLLPGPWPRIRGLSPQKSSSSQLGFTPLEFYFFIAAAPGGRLPRESYPTPFWSNDSLGIWALMTGGGWHPGTPPPALQALRDLPPHAQDCCLGGPETAAGALMCHFPHSVMKDIPASALPSRILFEEELAGGHAAGTLHPPGGGLFLEEKRRQGPWGTRDAQ